MDSIKYIGLDVHRDTISVTVLNAEGKLVMQSVIATHASAILDFLQGLRGTLHVTFEEGTHSAWLYDLLVRRVAHLVVCNPRQNALLKAGSKSDAIDARKLAELLRAGLLSPVYHGQNSTAAVKHLGRSYAALTEDTTRIMGRLKALYRSQAIACAGKQPYGARHRDEWLMQLRERGLRRRAEDLRFDDGLCGPPAAGSASSLVRREEGVGCGEPGVAGREPRRALSPGAEGLRAAMGQGLQAGNGGGHRRGRCVCGVSAGTWSMSRSLPDCGWMEHPVGGYNRRISVYPLICIGVKWK